MKPYIKTLLIPHLDVTMIVEVTPRDEASHSVKVLDFVGNEDMLADAGDLIEETGIQEWVDTFGQGAYRTRYAIHEKIISRRVLLHRFVNYRAVDPAHVDKLMNLAVSSITHSVERFDGVHPCDFVDGVLVLPGNFIIARAHNKVVANSGFIKEKGISMVTAQLGTNGRDKLFELEGYRLFRNLNTLDDILDPMRYGLDMSHIPVCIANNVEYIDTPKGTIYIVMPVEYNQAVTYGTESAAVQIPSGVYFALKDPHLAAKSIINSYIEKR